MAEGKFSIPDLRGHYAYKFDGFTMVNNIPYNLRGLGELVIHQNGKIKGHHRSSISPLQGQAATIDRGLYKLEGKITDSGITDNCGSFSASIHFKNEVKGGQNVDGDFYVQVSESPDRLWFVSSGATLPGHKGMAVDELVTLEAVRMVLPATD